MTVKCFEFNMFPVNTYVLSDETNEAVIIDAGCYYDDEQEMLKQYIERNGLQRTHSEASAQHSSASGPFIRKCFCQQDVWRYA